MSWCRRLSLSRVIRWHSTYRSYIIPRGEEGIRKTRFSHSYVTARIHGCGREFPDGACPAYDIRIESGYDVSKSSP
jgi:hypothetical protein